jgi:hypothetical protein
MEIKEAVDDIKESLKTFKADITEKGKKKII